MYHNSTTFLPERILATKNISNNAKLTYAFLYRQAGQTGDYHPDLKKLADDVGVAVSTVQGYLWELHRAGFIDVRLHVWRATLKV
jgi:DNA-binding MarR family transcriptional regulator